jgi:hypothetical protein
LTIPQPCGIILLQSRGKITLTASKSKIESVCGELEKNFKEI